MSMHYAHRSWKPSRRALEDWKLVAEIHADRAGYPRVYGVRKTWNELKRRDVVIGRDRVARLMRQEGLEGVRRGKKQRTTIPDEAALERARDLLQRDFAATAPNEKRVADTSPTSGPGTASSTSPSSSTATQIRLLRARRARSRSAVTDFTPSRGT